MCKTKGKIFANIISSKPAVGWFSLRQWRHKISDFWQNCEKFCTVGKQPPELTMMFVLTMNFRESRQSLDAWKANKRDSRELRSESFLIPTAVTLIPATSECETPQLRHHHLIFVRQVQRQR